MDGVADDVIIEPDLMPARKLSLDCCDFGKSSDVFYYELDSVNPGLCCESEESGLTWSPIKMSKGSVRAASASSDSEDEVKPSMCVSISYESRDGKPGLEIETVDEESNDTFWVPVAHRTRSRARLKPPISS